MTLPCKNHAQWGKQRLIISRSLSTCVGRPSPIEMCRRSVPEQLLKLLSLLEKHEKKGVPCDHTTCLAVYTSKTGKDEVTRVSACREHLPIPTRRRVPLCVMVNTSPRSGLGLLVWHMLRCLPCAEQLDGDHRGSHPANEHSEPQETRCQGRIHKTAEKAEEQKESTEQTIASPYELFLCEEEPDKDY